MSRRVLALTTSRADYGLLRPLLRGIDNHPELELILVVSGTHLSPRHGHTVKEIEADGFRISQRIDLFYDAESDSTSIAVRAAARMSEGMASALRDLKPDVLLVLGDRYEILSACTIALLMNVPIAHIHGGELTEGSTDDAVRHSITKMASLHFPVHETYAARLMQLGESESDIVLIDPPVSASLSEFVPCSRAVLSERIGIELPDPIVALSYHPMTRNHAESVADLQNLLLVVGGFPDLTLVVSGTNADPGSSEHQEILGDFVRERPTKRAFVASLGHTFFLSLLHHCKCLIGNSSSGVIEAPLLGVPSLDVGKRQKGRVVPSSVTHCAGDVVSIRTALDAVLRNKQDRSRPLSASNSVERITEALTTHSLRLDKEFVDR